MAITRSPPRIRERSIKRYSLPAPMMIWSGPAANPTCRMKIAAYGLAESILSLGISIQKKRPVVIHQNITADLSPDLEGKTIQINAPRGKVHINAISLLLLLRNKTASRRLLYFNQFFNLCHVIPSAGLRVNISF